MLPCADSLFYFFTSYSYIRILSLRTQLIRFFQCRLVQIHCFTFSHHIPTFEFFLLGPRSLDRILSLRTPLIRFFKCRLVWIHCFTFFTSYSHIRILSLRTPNVALCAHYIFPMSPCADSLFHFFTSYSHIRILSLCSTFFTSYSHIRIFSRYSLFYFFYIIFPHSNFFS